MCTALGVQIKHLAPCIAINILDFDLFNEDPYFHHFYAFKEFDHPELELSRDLTIHFLELPKMMKLLECTPSDKQNPLKMVIRIEENK